MTNWATPTIPGAPLLRVARAVEDKGTALRRYPRRPVLVVAVRGAVVDVGSRRVRRQGAAAQIRYIFPSRH